MLNKLHFIYLYYNKTALYINIVNIDISKMHNL